jgi:hypothetical protein
MGVAPGGTQFLRDPGNVAGRISQQRGINPYRLQFGVVTYEHLAGELPGFAIAPVPQLGPDIRDLTFCQDEVIVDRIAACLNTSSG